MLNFERLLKLKIIVLAVAVALFAESTVYGTDLSDVKHLRVPLLGTAKNQGLTLLMKRWEARVKGEEDIFCKELTDGKLYVRIYLTEEALRNLPEGLINRIEQTVTWGNFSPDSYIGRRTVVLEVAKPTKPIVIDGRRIKAVRIKGVCYKPAGSKTEPEMPSLEVYQGDIYSLQPTNVAQFNEEGQWRPEPAEQQYRGVYRHAKDEFENTRQVMKGDVLTDYPLGWGEYLTKGLSGAQAGFVIFGMEDVKGRLISNILSGLKKKLNVSIKALLHSKIVSSDTVDTVRETFERAMYKYGRSLRDFHDKGYIHGYPHFGNVSLTEEGQCKIYDLANVKYKTELNFPMAMGYQLLDLSMAIGSIERNIRLELASILGRLHKIYQIDLVGAFVRGYFYDFVGDGRLSTVNYEELKRILREASNVPISNVWSYVVELMREVLTNDPDKEAEELLKRAQNLWVEEGDHIKALELYLEIMERFVDNEEARDRVTEEIRQILGALLTLHTVWLGRAGGENVIELLEKAEITKLLTVAQRVLARDRSIKEQPREAKQRAEESVLDNFWFEGRRDFSEFFLVRKQGQTLFFSNN